MKKILAIDDQKDNLSIIKAIIKMSMPNYEIIFAESGKEGIKKAEKDNPDVILLDIIMPEMDGYETCELLKKNYKTKDIPVVMITAIDTDAESKAKAFDLGADAFLTKPIEPVELVAQLKVVLRVKEAEAKLVNERNNLEKAVDERTLELKKSESKYKSLIENSQQPIIVLRDGIVVFANRISMEISGYQNNEIINQPFLGIIFEEDQPKILENYKSRLAGKPFDENIDFRIINKEGKLYWYNYKASNIDWEGKSSMLYILNDITKQKEVEQLKKISIKRTELLLELYNKSISLNKKELFTFVLDKAVDITNSKVGFFHEFDDKTEIITLNVWNKAALKNCNAPYESHYPIDEAGNWVESVRQKKPIIYNDYKVSPNQKGLPEGHTHLIRFMSIPVMLNDTVYFIFGVGNKDSDYTEADVENMQIVSNELSKILEKKKFEEQIILERDIAEQNEYRFKTLHNASFGGIAIHDKGLILDCNYGLSKITGYSYDELINSDGLRLIADESVNTVRKNIELQYEKPYEVIGVRKNGEKYPIRVEGKKIPYKGKEVRVVEFRDISEQKKLEEEQLHKEQLLNETGRLAKIGGWELDVATMTAYYSRETKRIYGIPLDMDPPAGIEGMKYYADEGKPIIEKAVKEALEDGKPYDVEVPFINEQGERLWVRTIGLAEKKNGKVSRLYGTFQDITKQKQWEKEIVEARQKAEQSDMLKTAFLANMSHEIRTPMNGILGYIELLKMPDLTSKERDDYSNIISKSSDRLLNTINDIIEFSKIEAGDIPIKPEKISLLEEVESIVDFFVPEARNKGVRLYLDKQGISICPDVDTDRSKFESILTNLIKNAIKFTDEGEIQVGFKFYDETIEIQVKDSGCGIDKDKLDVIFERFMQADITMTRGHEGSGLGLSICKAYVEKMGGRMWVESEYGIGSTFYFTIPCSSSMENMKKPFTETTVNKSENVIAKHKNTSTPKILIAEDDSTSYSLAQLILEQENIEEVHAENGKEAVEIFTKNPDITLILMDIKMPVMNGLDATREIRKLNPAIPIIALTAYAMPGDKEKAIKAGCNDYITKPLKRQLLLDKVHQYI